MKMKQTRKMVEDCEYSVNLLMVRETEALWLNSFRKVMKELNFQFQYELNWKHDLSHVLKSIVLLLHVE